MYWITPKPAWKHAELCPNNYNACDNMQYMYVQDDVIITTLWKLNFDFTVQISYNIKQTVLSTLIAS